MGPVFLSEVTAVPGTWEFANLLRIFVRILVRLLVRILEAVLEVYCMMLQDSFIIFVVRCYKFSKLLRPGYSDPLAYLWPLQSREKRFELRWN